MTERDQWRLKLEREPAHPHQEMQKALLPHHVAIIMDGNRRWAKQRGLPSLVGHWQGAQALFRTVQSAIHLGVKVLTVYTFSTENWSRSLEEIQIIMTLLRIHLNSRKAQMIKEGVRVKTIGDLSRLPVKLITCLEEITKSTSQGKNIDLVLAINYGARDDMRRAFMQMMEDHEKGHLKKEEITETLIGRYLDTASWKDPDLIIRTSGEHRLSNFLLWQSSYSELYITNTLWPDFDEGHLKEAITEFQKRNRRIGC
ncbi:Isoprenyl transferase [Rhabdochlamydiaceae symbiont of Dictyostelium giganteum]